MGLIKWILIIAVVLIVGVVILGNLNNNPLNGNNGSNNNGDNNTPTPSGVNWNEIRTNDIAKVSSDFKEPKYIPISSEGWEDSEYISQDGNTLYFIYLNLDLLELPEVVFIGPNRDPQGSCKNGVSCGYVSSKSQRGDTFYSTKLGDNSWSTPQPHPLTLDEPVHGIVFVNDDKAYFHIGEGGSQETQIAYSEKVDGEWQVSVLMPEPINSNEDDMHPFLFGDKTLYFSSGRGDGKLRIYRSNLLSGDIATGEWSQPEVIVESNFVVGEPTLPADGSRLYFLQIFNSGTGKYTADLMYAEKK